MRELIGSLTTPFDLFANFRRTDEQLDFPVVYASALNGFAMLDMKTPSDNMRALFETIISHVSPPAGDPNAPLQMQISALDYSTYTGRLGVGRVTNGKIKTGQAVTIMNEDKQIAMSKSTKCLVLKA